MEPSTPSHVCRMGQGGVGDPWGRSERLSCPPQPPSLLQHTPVALLPIPALLQPQPNAQEVFLAVPGTGVTLASSKQMLLTLFSLFRGELGSVARAG